MEDLNKLSKKELIKEIEYSQKLYDGLAKFNHRVLNEWEKTQSTNGIFIIAFYFGGIALGLFIALSILG